MSNVADALDLNYYAFDNSSEMNKILTNINFTKAILCGIGFDDSLFSHKISNLPILPSNLNITIR